MDSAAFGEGRASSRERGSHPESSSDASFSLSRKKSQSCGMRMRRRMGGGNNGASPSFLSFSSLPPPPPPPPAVAQYALPTTKISLSLASVSEKAVGRPYSSLLLFAFLCSFFFSRLRRDRFLLLFLPPLPCPPSGAPEISKSQIISSKSASGFLMIVS